MLYVQRQLAASLRRALATFPVLVLTGARQTGKTTLLRREFGSEYRFVSIEDPDVRLLIQEDPRRFLAQNGPPCIYDEVQNAPELLSYVKTAVDEDRKPGRWILTGSRVFPLMEGVSQSLAGRAAVFQLHGLSMLELAEQERYDTPRQLLVGTFPEPRLNPQVDLRFWMASYLQTYLERDVRQLVQVGDLASFETLLRLAAARTAQVLNLASLARDAALAANTARRWLSVLEASGQVFRLPPWTQSSAKRLVKSPKLHFLDSGLAAFLTGHRDAGTLWEGPMKGALFESAVVAEALKWFHDHGDIPGLYFWRSSDGLEVDLVIEAAGKLHGIETKANSTPVPRMAEGLLKWRRLLGRQAGRGAVACDGAKRLPLGDGVEAVPWREIGIWIGEVLG
jgi:hypothetical protein